MSWIFKNTEINKRCDYLREKGINHKDAYVASQMWAAIITLHFLVFKESYKMAWVIGKPRKSNHFTIATYNDKQDEYQIVVRNLRKNLQILRKSLTKAGTPIKGRRRITITKSKRLIPLWLIILMYAAHEVRHRMQFKKADLIMFTSRSWRKKLNRDSHLRDIVNYFDKLITAYRDHNVFQQRDVKYRRNKLEFDAHIIQMLFQSQARHAKTEDDLKKLLLSQPERR
jgi:hypothetical protein